ncbi:MAG: hypothetical protein RIQ68_328 [Pseudomonadota bacterium]
MLRAHADLILIVAGVFLLLPTLAQAFYFPPPATSGFNEAAMRALLAYYGDHFAMVFAMRLVTLAGTGTILALLTGPGRPTVGEAIGLALRLLPSLFLVDVIGQFIVMAGLVLLILPGLYILARAAVASPVMMAESTGNPLHALGRSFDLSRGLGWQIFGLIAIIFVVLWIATSAFATVLGVIGSLLMTEGAARILRLALAALSTTLLMLGSTLISAGLYRQLVTLKSGM